MIPRGLAITTLLATQTAFTQVTLGHRFGVALSRMEFDGGNAANTAKLNQEQLSLIGVAVELPVTVELTKRLRLTSGISFVNKGFRPARTEEYRVGFLQVPLEFGACFRRGRLSITPSAGAAFGRNMRGQRRWHYSSPNDEYDHWGNAAIGFDDERLTLFRAPKYEVALLASTSFTYSLKRAMLHIDVAYQHGVSNSVIRFVDTFSEFMGWPPDMADVAPAEAYHRTWIISLGYSLPLCPEPKKAKPIFDSSDVKKRARRPLLIGQRGGASVSWMAFDASLPEEVERVVDGAEPILGFTAGTMVRIPFGEHLSLQPEIAYTQRGWQCQWHPRPSVRNDLMRMNYLELPLLARYEYGSRKLRGFLLAGPVFGRGLGGFDIATRGDQGNGNTFSFDWYMSFADGLEYGGYKRYDFAVAVGAGVAWKVGRSEVFFDFRYQHSTTDFVNDPSTLYSDYAEARHRSLLFSLGYLLPWPAERE